MSSQFTPLPEEAWVVGADDVAAAAVVDCVVAADVVGALDVLAGAEEVSLLPPPQAVSMEMLKTNTTANANKENLFKNTPPD
jgi:hypothetical protein